MEAMTSCTSSTLPSSKMLYSKPRHGWFTHPGSEDDQCPIHQDGGKIFLYSEQIIVVMELFP
jgi:hypothetical protein